MSVISIDLERAKRSPHITGEARCMACQHTWVGVAQVGTSTLDCPECKAEKGVFLKHARDADSPALHCGCGCWAYAVYSYGLMCINCGDVKSIPTPPTDGEE
jgi:hypothetical protein